MYRKTSLNGRILLLFGALLVPAAGPAHAAEQQRMVAGEIILYLQPGTTNADAQALAAKVKAQSVVPLLLKDCYTVELPAALRTDAETTAAVAQLKLDPRVRWVNPSFVLSRNQQRAEPNDPRYRSGEQWNLKLIRMPEAWALQKGQAKKNIAVIDSGFDPQHEDSRGQFLIPGSKDIADNDDDITADGSDPDFDHGTHVSGVAIAISNNSTGIAGICWENIKCMGVKIQKKGVGNLDGPSGISAPAYVADNAAKYNIVACNMSYGGVGDPTDINSPFYQSVKKAADAGVLMVAAAGNSSGDNKRLIPAALPFVTTVSAVGPNGRLATYSSFGKVDIAAPGGDQDATGQLGDGVLSLRQNNRYSFEQGTSDAAPHVTAVLALLMSVPNTTPQAALQALKQNANRSGLGLGTLPDSRYGYGVLDAYAALASISVRAVIIDPVGYDPSGQSSTPNTVIPPIETLNPVVRMDISNVPLNKLVVKIDGKTVDSQLIANSVESGTAQGPNPRYTIAFKQKFSPDGTQQHTIAVTGTSADGTINTSDTRIVTIQPHVFPAGLTLVSLPYLETAADSPTNSFRDALQLLGQDIVLYRWVNVSPQGGIQASVPVGRYAANGQGTQDPNSAYATFLPPDKKIVLDKDPATDVRPIGLGYFLRANSGIAVKTYGAALSTQATRIPLQDGWNLVGDPFPFSIPFNGVQIEIAQGQRLSVQQAVDRNLIQPVIYRYVGGIYEFHTLPGGDFMPWEGHWLYVVPPDPRNLRANSGLTLIMAPVGAGNGSRSAGSRSVGDHVGPEPKGTGAWALQLTAQANGLRDTHNYIGMSADASESEDRLKVPKPPLPSPFVSLAVSRSESRAGLYMQDLRPLGGVRTWDVVVVTDQPNVDVVVAWPTIGAVPKNYRLILTDQATGQTVDMRNQSSYRFNSGHSASSRGFLITARPGGFGGRAIVTNVFVNPGRSNGRGDTNYEIGYSISQESRVDVSILSFGGRTLAQVSPTRAVASGDNRVVWNGRDSQGKPLPAGTYVVQVRAVTPEGDVTRQVQSLLITGR